MGQPPRKIRLSRTAYDAGAITCGACEADFTARDTDSSTDTARDGRALARDVTAHIKTAYGRGNHLMDDESVRRRSADATGRERAGEAHVADRGDDRERRMDGGRRLRDASTRDQETPRHQAAEGPRLHQHNVVMNREAVNSTPLERDSGPRAVGDDAARDAADKDGYRRRDDPVQRARIAVDQLVTRRREIGHQRAEATRTEQVNRWHHDDRSTSSAARSSLADVRIDGGGVAR